MPRDCIALQGAGIAFAITSGRPPRGMAVLIHPLGLRTPIAAFNGGVFVAPDTSVIEECVLPADVARRAVETISRNRMDVWIYSGRDRLVRDPQAPTSPASNGPSSSRRPLLGILQRR